MYIKITWCDAVVVYVAYWLGGSSVFLDARHLPTGSRIEADLCIIGAGAAGISIALQFSNKPFKVVILEAGGLSSDPATQSLYAGEIVGLSCVRPDLSRSRFFGGSTNCWGGWCRPLDDLDMEDRPWIPNSGWPIKRDELQPYYEQTHDLLRLGPFEYSEAFWRTKLDGVVDFLPLTAGRLHNFICQLSPPARFGQLYSAALKSAPNIEVYLHANVTELEIDHRANTVTSIKVATLTGNDFAVEPRTIALCAGGIENARLLLASNKVARCGIGNEHDVVGRYFMDHPGTRMGKVRLPKQTRHRRLYDNSLINTRRRTHLKHLNIAAHVSPRETVQRESKLPNSRTYLVAQYFRSMSASYKALKQVRQIITNRQKFGVPFSEVLSETKRALPVLLREAPQLAFAVLDDRINPAFISRKFHLETIIEPVPNADSRVTLSRARDRLGVPTVKIDWRLSDLDADNFRRVHQMVVEDLRRDGLIIVLDEEHHIGKNWPTSVEGCWHHMGTTRMHPNLRKGVVDANCRVHGVSNLYVAGSSVFPTAGSDNPTITIVALALRLAEHLEVALSQVALKQAS